MLDKKLVVNNIELIKERLALKGYTFDTEVFLKLEDKRKTLQTKLEDLQHKRNATANDIKKLFKTKAPTQEIEIAKLNAIQIGKDVTEAKVLFEVIDQKIKDFMLKMPNIPNEKCPIGAGEEENVLVRTYMTPPKFNFKVKDHVELTQVNNDLDFEMGVNLAKSRFVLMKGNVARLHRALAQFMLDLHTEEHGYLEVNVPVIANRKTLTGTGQLPKFEDDLFKIEGMDMALIPTAEVPLTNMIKNTKFKPTDLPCKFTAHSLCFRSEAGSAGRDVKGILRQHQFEKVELVQIVEPDKSDKALEEILNHAEKVLKLLKLPYRVVELCTGDLGFGAMKTYDIEVWVPSQETYREISSCSNMGDFQARRLGVKIKTDENTEFVHTLNGSGLAVGRTLLAVLENNQDEYGKIKVPDILIPYMNGKIII